MVADLIHLDQDMYGMQNDPINMALRRYAGMAVTNLTFGDVVNKVQTGRVLWRIHSPDQWAASTKTETLYNLLLKLIC